MLRFSDSKDHPTRRLGSATIGWTRGKGLFGLDTGADPRYTTNACARSGRFPRENTASSTASSITPYPVMNLSLSLKRLGRVRILGSDGNSGHQTFQAASNPA